MSMLLTEKNPEALDGIRRPSSRGEGVCTDPGVWLLDGGPREDTSLEAKDWCLERSWPGTGGDCRGGSFLWYPTIWSVARLSTGRIGCCRGVTG